MPIIHGVWVKKDYIEDVSKTKSPYESSSFFSGVACMQIENTGPKSDSLNIGYSLNNHEGSDFILYFKNGQNASSLKTNLSDYDLKGGFYELGYRIKNRDTILILYLYDRRKVLKNSVQYIRVANKALDENDAAWGIEYITNKKLLTGKYLLTDSIGKTVNVSFFEDGNVLGFKGFEHYYLATDFGGGEPGGNLDEIIFDLNSKNPSNLTFKINSDTIYLYGTYLNQDSTELIAGKLKYRLVKQK